jgi:hypothetical protein
MIGGYVVGNIVHVLVGFPMEKNSGPFAEYLRKTVSSLALFNVLSTRMTGDDALLLRLVKVRRSYQSKMWY